MHDTRKRHLTGLHNQMNMVGHQTKRMDTATNLFNRILQDQLETKTVLVVKKNRIADVTTKDYMIKSAGKMNTRFACHGLFIS